MKRELSPSRESTGASPMKRKDERDHDQGPPIDLASAFVPPPKLRISVLTWEGEPTTYDVDGNDLMNYVGAYINAASSSLTYIGWDKDHRAFQYAPSFGRITFDYERHAFVGTASSQITEYGAIIADDMSPKVRVCDTNVNPWPQTFSEDLNMVRSYATSVTFTQYYPN